MAQNFHIAEKVANMVDPQKTNLWEVEFTELPKCLKDHPRWKSVIQNKLKFRAQSVSIPDRKVAYTSSKFLGHNYNFPLPSDDGNKSIDIDFVEREDQTVITAFNSWIHEIFDMAQLRNDWYYQYPDFKHSFTSKITIRQYGLNGELLPTEVNIYGAFINSISSVRLDYGKSDAVKYSVSFAFDYWALDKTEVESEPGKKTSGPGLGKGD